MSQAEPSVLSLMVGSICIKKRDNDKEFATAIQKKRVQSCFLTQEGLAQDSQADKKHHGGRDKALLMFSASAYESINKHFNSNLDYTSLSFFGENVVTSVLNEENVFIGMQLKIGEAIVEVSQPREPCWKLSENTNIKGMLQYIVQTGFTGWYCRVVKEGVIKEEDKIETIYQPSSISIMTLNRLLHHKHDDVSVLRNAIQSEKLGIAFQSALDKKLKTL